MTHSKVYHIGYILSGILFIPTVFSLIFHNQADFNSFLGDFLLSSGIVTKNHRGHRDCSNFSSVYSCGRKLQKIVTEGGWG